MNDMQLQCIGMILVPLMIPAIGFLYLFLAFSHEDYVNKKGQKYFCELHPNEYPPQDASYWCLLKIEQEREIKKRKRELNQRKVEEK